MGFKKQTRTARRKFITQTGLAITALTLSPILSFTKSMNMKAIKQYDAIIIGGSYSGLAAAMALGRARKHVLAIDSGEPCNAQTPHSHNFLTQDGNTPAAIARQARSQVEKYPTVKFQNGLATSAAKAENGFEISIQTGGKFYATKLIFATGITDIMPDIKGFADCWGITAIHCPYCHGYEVRDERTGILGNGEEAFEFAKLISNWTKDLTLFTNSRSGLTSEQLVKLSSHNIRIIEKEIAALDHQNGHIRNIVFKDATKSPLAALYAPRSFKQHCNIPESLGCELTDDGYIKTNAFQETTVHGVYACGDNVTKMRTVANAVAMGTTAGLSVSKKIILEEF